MIDLRNVKIYYGEQEIDAGYLGTNQFYGEDPLPWEVALDSDFSGDKDGEFRYIGRNPYVEIPHVIKGVNVTSYRNMFRDTGVLGVRSTNKNVTDMYAMFYSSSGESLDVSRLDTSNVTNMFYIFGRSAAKSINLNDWDTSSVTDMGYMFYNSSVRDLNLSGWDTSSVTDMERMFGMSSITNLNMSGWDTSSVTTMNHMFEYIPARHLDLSSFTFNRRVIINTWMSSTVPHNRKSLIDVSNINFVDYAYIPGDTFRNIILDVGYAMDQENADWLNARINGEPFIVKPKEV